MLVFLDASAMVLAMEDTAVRSKLKHLGSKGHRLVTSTTVAGELQQLMMEKGKEANFLLVETLHYLQVSILPPRSGLEAAMPGLYPEDDTAGKRISTADQLHLALAQLWKVDLYVTTRAQARALNLARSQKADPKIVDVDTLFHELLH